MRNRLIIFLLVCCSIGGYAQPAAALDDDHWQQAQVSINDGIEYLLGAQNDDGSWSPTAGPAVTALVLTALLDHPHFSHEHPAVRKALNYILSRQQPDGGIYDGILANYNTSICVSALSRVKAEPGIAEVLQKAELFLRHMQWGAPGAPAIDPQGNAIDAEHPFFGGTGYGKHGRPDGSNTQLTIQALSDLGVDCEDQAYQRAVEFFTRLQGTEANAAYGHLIAPDGGAIYASSQDKDHIGTPQSMAGEYEDEQGVTRLRTYGSMTYAMFKTYVYAQLPRDDARVTDAVRWIKQNYTVQHNPGMPEQARFQGYYYYLLTLSRALDAWNSDLITADGKKIAWDNDLVDQLSRLQRDDGSWINTADRWMEADTNLVTAYALIALTSAVR